MAQTKKHKIAAMLAIYLLAGIGTAVAGAAGQGAVAGQPLQFQVNGFSLDGDTPLSARRIRHILQPYTGRHEGIERLRQAAATLEKALQQRGFSLYRVTVPPQKLSGGVVRLKISRLVVGDIRTSGNRWFSAENIRASLPQLKKGESPNTHALSRALGVANFNTAKRSQLLFSRGAVAGTVDAEVAVRDSHPQQTFAWLNNTGTRQTTRSRLGLGYQHRNLFGRDHQLSLTYTTSPEDVDRVKQYGAVYRVPVYRWTGMFSFYGVRSTVDTGTVAEFFDVSGGGKTLGLTYTQVLNKAGKLRQRLIFDLADKLFENDATFAEQLIGADVRSRPLSAQYHAEWDTPRWGGLFNIGNYWNLDGGTDNTAAAYQTVRAGADQNWNAWRATLNADLRLPKAWQIQARLLAQYSDDLLIPGEQFGLGGINTVRGFEERELTGDRGISARLQLWSPPTVSQLQLGVFSDAGSLRRLQPKVGEVGSDTLVSIGVSARWGWKSRLNLQADYGYVLDGIDSGNPDATTDNDSRLHASLVYRF